MDTFLVESLISWASSFFLGQVHVFLFSYFIFSFRPFPLYQCLLTRWQINHPQIWQSSEKSQEFREKIQYLMNTLPWIKNKWFLIMNCVFYIFIYHLFFIFCHHMHTYIGSCNPCSHQSWMRSNPDQDIQWNYFSKQGGQRIFVVK